MLTPHAAASAPTAPFPPLFTPPLPPQPCVDDRSLNGSQPDEIASRDPEHKARKPGNPETRKTAQPSRERSTAAELQAAAAVWRGVAHALSCLSTLQPFPHPPPLPPQEAKLKAEVLPRGALSRLPALLAARPGATCVVLDEVQFFDATAGNLAAVAAVAQRMPVRACGGRVRKRARSARDH